MSDLNQSGDYPISHFNQTKKRAYVIADNALAAKAGWDREMLAVERQGLIDLGFEVKLTGFNTAEVDLIIEGWQMAATEAASPEDSVSEPGAADIGRG